jgi:hypothetical protein
MTLAANRGLFQLVNFKQLEVFIVEVRGMKVVPCCLGIAGVFTPAILSDDNFQIHFAGGKLLRYDA